MLLLANTTCLVHTRILSTPLFLILVWPYTEVEGLGEKQIRREMLEV